MSDPEFAALLAWLTHQATPTIFRRLSAVSLSLLRPKNGTFQMPVTKTSVFPGTATSANDHAALDVGISFWTSALTHFKVEPSSVSPTRCCAGTVRLAPNLYAQFCLPIARLGRTPHPNDTLALTMSALLQCQTEEELAGLAALERYPAGSMNSLQPIGKNLVKALFKDLEWFDAYGAKLQLAREFLAREAAR